MLTNEYSPNHNAVKRIREIRKAEKQRYESARAKMKKAIGSSTVDYTYSAGSVISNNTITTTRLGDSKVTIDGGENGSMRVDVPLVVNGRDVMKELDEMRDALLLLKRDVDMEDKYPRLRELKDEYERTLEKYKTFEAIKDSK